jgi:hypothetical protein
VQRRGKAAQDTRRDAHAKCKEQQSRVDVGAQSVGSSVTWQERDERPHGGGRQRHPERSAGKGQKNAIGQKLPPDPPARSAQGQPGADLTLPGRSAREKQSGNI